MVDEPPKKRLIRSSRTGAFTLFEIYRDGYSYEVVDVHSGRSSKFQERKFAIEEYTLRMLEAMT
jgi:hypothetical protein